MLLSCLWLLLLWCDCVAVGLAAVVVAGFSVSSLLLLYFLSLVTVQVFVVASVVVLLITVTFLCALLPVLATKNIPTATEICRYRFCY